MLATVEAGVVTGAAVVIGAAVVMGAAIVVAAAVAAGVSTGVGVRSAAIVCAACTACVADVSDKLESVLLVTVGATVAIGVAVVGGRVVTGVTESVAALHDSSKLGLLGCSKLPG